MCTHQVPTFKGCAAPCAGRVYSKRSAGKLVFYDVKADGEKVQVSSGWPCFSEASDPDQSPVSTH